MQYAARFGVSPDEALRRLRAQQASVAATDAIRSEFASRLAGISIEHQPEYRIVVLLTGSDPVADRSASGVPIVFKTGARATREQAIAAMRAHLIDLRSELPGERGVGYDQRTGEVVLLVRNARRAEVRTRRDPGPRRAAERRAGARGDQRPSRAEYGRRRRRLCLRANADGHRDRCTSGFIVTDGSRTGSRDRRALPRRARLPRPGRKRRPSAFAGQWGLAYQDVQINLSPRRRRAFVLCEPRRGLAPPARDLAQSREHACRRLRLPLWRKLGLQLRRGRSHRLCAAGQRSAAARASRPG